MYRLVGGSVHTEFVTIMVRTVHRCQLLLAAKPATRDRHTWLFRIVGVKNGYEPRDDDHLDDEYECMQYRLTIVIYFSRVLAFNHGDAAQWSDVDVVVA